MKRLQEENVLYINASKLEEWIENNTGNYENEPDLPCVEVKEDEYNKILNINKVILTDKTRFNDITEEFFRTGKIVQVSLVTSKIDTVILSFSRFNLTDEVHESFKTIKFKFFDNNDKFYMSCEYIDY